MKQFLLSLLCGFMLLGCNSKDEISSGSATLRVENNSRHSYRFILKDSNDKVLINDVLSGGDIMTYSNRPEGYYYWTATQLSGYLLYPTVEKGSFNLNSYKSIVFPF